MISGWDWAPHWALHWAWSLVGNLSPSLPLPPALLSLSLSQTKTRNKKQNKKKIIFWVLIPSYWNSDFHSSHSPSSAVPVLASLSAHLSDLFWWDSCNLPRIGIYCFVHAPLPHLYGEISEIRDLDLHLMVFLTLGTRPHSKDSECFLAQAATWLAAFQT